MSARRTGRRGWIGNLAVASVIASAVLFFALPGGAPRPAKATVPACGDSGTPALVAVHGPHMYIDSDTGLNAAYVGYTVRAGSTPRSGLWIKVSGFAGGIVSLSDNESDSQLVPDISANQSSTQFFLFKATGPTTTTQTHQVSVYQGEPSSGTLLCNRTGSILTVAETIKALANKVRTIDAAGATDQAEIGDAVTVTVNGDTGTLGAGPDNDPGVMSITPMALTSFPASAWRLERTEISIKPTGVEASPTTYVNRLYLPGSSGPDRPYTAVYTFRAVGSAASRAAVKPIQYIASGTQVKHTDPGSIPLGELPIVKTTANLSLTKTASTSEILKSGVLSSASRTITYTVTVTNTGDGVGTLDDITDTLQSGMTYVVGTTEVNGTAAANPTQTGLVLTWSGPIRIPPFDSLVVTYDVILPDVAATYVNTAEGHYGTTTIDTSADVTNSSPATASVRIFSTSGTITAGNDTTTTPANTQKTITVTGNDSSTYGSVSVQSVTDPPHGSTTVSSATQVLYTPDAGYSGTDSFTYTISDGASTASATVTVTVTPSAINDTYSTTNTTGAKSFATVLTNDACTSCTVTTKTLTTTSTPSIANGTMILSSNGTFTWERSSSFTDTITFTYTATDGAGSTTTATVTIYVGKAVPDTSLVPYNTMTIIDVLANDLVGGSPNVSSASNPPNGSTVVNNKKVEYTPDSNFWGTDSFTYTVSGASTAVNVLVEPPDSSTQTDLLTSISSTVASAGCSSCTYSVVTPPSSGVFTLSSNGSYTYVPAANGTFTATWRVTDPATLLTSDAILTIKVGPRAVNDSYTMFAGTTLTGTLTTNDTCAATCSSSKLTNPTVASASATVNSNGTFSFTSPTDIGTITFTYQISSTSSVGVTSDSTVTVSVDGARADEASTGIGQAVTVDVEANDPCISCTVSAVATPSLGAAVVNGNETITYTPPAGFSGRVQFDYTVTKNSRSTTATVTVYVGPKANDDSAITTAGQSVDLNVLLNDTCARCNVTSVGTPDHGSASVTANVVTYSPGGWTSSSLSDLATFTYTITNSYGKTSTADVTVYVGAPPDAVDDSKQVTAGSVLTFDPRVNDSCVSCDVDKETEPTAGAAAALATNSIRYTPQVGASGQVTMKYLLTDPVTGLFDNATVTIKVLPLAVDDSVRTGINTQVTTNVAFNDSCTSCTVTVRSSTGDPSPTLSVSSNQIVYTPSTGFTGSIAITYRITDSSISEYSDAVLTVVVDDALPDATSTPYQTAVNITNLLANDICSNCDLKSLNHSNRSINGSISMTQSGGKNKGVNFVPNSGTWGVNWFPYRAGPSTSGLQALSWRRSFSPSPAAVDYTVESTATILVGPPAITVNATGGVPINGNLVAGTPSNTTAVAASGCDGRCTFALVDPPTNGEITLNTDGSYQYTAPLTYAGSDTFTYAVTDTTTGVSTNGTVTFVVTAGSASISVVKSAGTIDMTRTTPTNRVDAGDTIPYTITITNTGTATLGYFSVVDSKIASLNCIPTLTSLYRTTGQTITCTGTYTITQADINAGSVSNTATVTAYYGAEPSSSTEVTQTDTETTTLTRSTQVQLVKETSATGLSVGASVGYTITVTNTGNTTLSSFSVTDPKIATLNCTPALSGLSRLPGETISCTGSHIVTQAEVDSGSLTNTANVSASGGGTTATASGSVTVTTAGIVSASIAKASTIDKTTAGPAGRVDAGDKINYTITVTNTGTATLENFTVTDAKLGTLVCAPDLGGMTLSPSQAVSCTGSYTITQGDINAGSVSNTASYSAASTTGTAISGSDTKVTALAQEPSIDVTKSTTATGLSLGAVIPYTIAVTNTGNTTLSSFSVSDNKIASLNCTPTLASLSRLPGETISCTGNYTVTQADMDAGSLTNTAIASATDGGTTVDDTSSVTLTSTGVVSASIVKASTIDKTIVGSTSRVDAGDKINYTITVTNTGDVSLNSFSVTDAKLGALVCTPGLSGLTRAPTYGVSCTGTYTITQADIDAGTVSNTANYSATSTTGTAISGSDTKVTTLTREPSIDVTKSTTATGLTLGAVIPYTITVTNTGNTTLSTISVTDPKVSTLSCPAGIDSLSLLPGDTFSCTGNHTVTQADMDAGGYSNTATASGTGSGTTVNDTSSVNLTTAQTTTASIVKVGTVDPTVVGGASDTRVNAGDKINYTITVTNTGNVTLGSFVVTDAKLGTLLCTPDLGSLTLAPTEAVSCTGSYTITQADIDAGSVSNTANYTAASTSGTAISGSGGTTVTLSQVRSVQIVKQADTATLPATGQTITYTLTVTNTGNTSLDTFAVTDAKLGSLNCTPGLSGLTRAPSETFSCTGTYTVLASDQSAGSLTNTGSVTAQTTVTDVGVSDTDVLTLTAPASPSILLDKSVTGIDTTIVGGVSDTSVDVGDRIDYSFTIRNNGNTNLTGFTLTDAKVGAITCDPPLAGLTLAPSGVINCSAHHTIVQDDIAAGLVTNTAEASAFYGGTPFTDTDSDSQVINDLDLTASIRVVKVALESTLPTSGGTIHYTITVENTGDLDVDTITVTDPILGTIVCDPVLAGLILEPTETTECSGTYVVTDDDVTAGFILNTAEATARTVDYDSLVTANDTFTIYESSMPSILLIKDAGTPNPRIVGPNDRIDAGDTIDYTFTISNTGNVPLAGVDLDDPLVTGFDCVDSDDSEVVLPASLGEGESVVCGSTYEITQDDIDDGVVENEASVTATFGGDDITDSDAISTTLTRDLSMEVSKEADVDRLPAPGESLDYTITIENTGSVTLAGFELSDTLLSDYDPFICEGGSIPSGGTSDPDDLTTTSLAPGDSIICTGTYTVLDSDDGAVSNEVTVSASGPLPGDAVSRTQTLVVTEDGSASMTIDKTAEVITDEVAPNDRPDAGDRIEYTIEVTNTGDADLDDLVIDDVMVADLPDYTCEADTDGDHDLDLDDAFTLTTGDSTTCTGSYTLTQDDLQFGEIENTASAQAHVGGGSLTAGETVTTDLSQVNDVEVEKNADVSTMPEAGTIINYTITVTNNGNVQYVGLEIDDVLIPALDCLEGSTPVDDSYVFEPGSTIECTGSYTVTSDDVESGVLTNTATVGGSLYDPSAPASRAGRADLGETFVTLDPEIDVTPDRRTHPTKIGRVIGIVWFDLDRDGEIDPNEPALPGALVNLDQPPTAQALITALRLKSARSGTIRTDQVGRYEFTDVTAGAHAVIADLPSNPSGILKSWDSDGATDWTVAVSVRSGSTEVADHAAIGTKSIIGTAYDDRDGNRIGHPLVTIVWAGFDRTFDTVDDVTFRTTGDATSFFTIGGLPTGSFTCRSTDPITGYSGASIEFELTAESANPEYVYCPFALPKTGLDTDRLLMIGLYLLGLGLLATGSSSVGRRRSNHPSLRRPAS